MSRYSTTMPSAAFAWWRTAARVSLDQIAAAHTAVEGAGPGRRYATQYLNQAYAVLLASVFQRYCRELHSQAAAVFAANVTPVAMQTIVLRRLTENRALDSKNANPGTLGNDFNRLGLSFWDDVTRYHPANHRRQQKLEELNLWRNAIAHQDFTDPRLNNRQTIQLREVVQWRSACNGLVSSFDAVVADHLLLLTGAAPW